MNFALNKHFLLLNMIYWNLAVITVRQKEILTISPEGTKSIQTSVNGHVAGRIQFLHGIELKSGS